MLVALNLFDIKPGRLAQYAEYLRRVQPVLDRYGAKVLLYGLTKMIFIGDCQQEYVGLIAYEDMQVFKRFSRDPEFAELRHLRDASTENYVLTVIEDFETMNHAAAYLEDKARQTHIEVLDEAGKKSESG